jgi:hypothetical protein
MEQGAYQISLHDQQRNGVETMALQATRFDLWIFDTQLKEWYTPEEFTRMFAKAPYQEGLTRRFKALDVQQGLVAADMQIQKILDKKQLLSNRVIEYYKNKISQNKP